MNRRIVVSKLLKYLHSRLQDKQNLSAEKKSSMIRPHTASTCTALLLWTEVPDIRKSATESAV